MKRFNIAMAAAVLATGGCTTNLERTPAARAPAPNPCGIGFDNGRGAHAAIAAAPRRCYTSDDISRTGATNAADALALLDPSITIHR